MEKICINVMGMLLLFFHHIELTKMRTRKSNPVVYRSCGMYVYLSNFVFLPAEDMKNIVLLIFWVMFLER